MDNNKYLKSVLSSQDLKNDSKELKELRAERERVKSTLFAAYSGEPPSIRYAGSYAKETLIKESYDLDMTCYFDRDSTVAGETLAEIFASVQSTLSKTYYVAPKTSALRLESTDRRYFHIDVVPGRFVDDERADVFLHQNNGTKERLKTNLDIHVDHIKNSGLTDPIRLLKLWKTRRALRLKQFVFELLIIDILQDKKSASLENQLATFWERVLEEADPVVPEDPANPSGNDLSILLPSATWLELQNTATVTLRQISNTGWETVF